MRTLHGSLTSVVGGLVQTECMSKQCEITYGQGVVDKFRTEIVRLQGLIADATLCAFAIAESENYNDPKVPFVDAREILRRLQG